MSLDTIENTSTRIKEISKQLAIDNLAQSPKIELLKELGYIYQAKNDYGQNLAHEKPLESYSLNITHDDVEIDFGDIKISLASEFREYSKTNHGINFFVINGLKPLQYKHGTKKRLKGISQEQQEKTLKVLGVARVDDLEDDIIFIPEQHSYQPLCINAIAHEMGHIICNSLSHSMIEEERNAHAWGLRFIRYIEEKYQIKTGAADSKISKVGLLSYQTKRALHKHGPSLLDQLDPHYEFLKKRFEDLDKQKVDRGFL